MRALCNALIIDDDENFRRSLELLVQREGLRDAHGRARSPRRASCLAAGTPDVFLVDLTLPDGDGLAWLRERARGERGRGDRDHRQHERRLRRRGAAAAARSTTSPSRSTARACAPRS